jgi:hypothetical protein
VAFNDRSEFINAQSSEKITLAHVEARHRLLPWTLDNSTIYYKDVEYYVINVHNVLSQLTEVFSYAQIANNTWFFDHLTNRLYIDIGSDPADTEIIATYRLFFGSAPIDATHDLTDSGKRVHYDGRIQLAPPYKHKIGVQQNLVSIIGNGSLKLINNDGALDEIYDKFIFDNQQVFIYSWTRDLPISERRIIYRGRITNKRFQPTNLSFQVKDQLIDLEQNVPQVPYDDTDNVNDSVKGRYKRWIYGRVDGLQLQSTDQIGEGYTITGTVSATAAGTSLFGVGTSFLSETSPGDKITIGTQEFTIETVDTDILITLDNEVTFSFAGQSAVLVPEFPTVDKNRTFFVADHESAKVTKTVVNSLQFNRVELSDTLGINSGDFLEFAGGERIEVRNVFDNTVVLVQNLIALPTIGSSVTRQPVQQVFIGSNLVESDDYSITNSTDTRIVFDNDTEFNIARLQNFAFDATFTNGTRSITTTDDIDLREILNPRDWIRPADLSYTTFYEILEVREQEVIIRINFADPTITDPAEGKKPEYIGDDTIVSANVLGRTVDGTATGTWITTAAQVMRDLIKESGITNVNETSFTDGATANQHLISMALPLSPFDRQITYKSAIDKLARSTSSVLTLDNDLDLKYKVLNAEWPDSPIEVDDFDVIKWNIETISGKNIRNTIANYRFKDVDRFTQETGNKTIQFSSDFVEKYVGTDKTDEVDLYLYNDAEAEIVSHRNTYFQTLGRSDITIETDLRLEDVEIGDVIVLNFQRMYKRFGDSSTRKKAAIVIGKTLNGEKTKIELTDFGNILNRSSVITPNSAPEWTSASEDEKLRYGYITDQQGIVNDEEDTSNTHLIS